VNNKINLLLSNGTEIAVEPGITPFEILARQDYPSSDTIVAAKLDGTLIDLIRPIMQSGKLEFIPFQSSEGKHVFWHSAAHLLAQAVKSLYPDAKFGFGPPLTNGFYYDIDFGEQVSADDLPRIEEEMRRIVKADLSISRKEVTKEEALRIFRERKENYKVEYIGELDGDISLYSQGDFIDLCAGPHLPGTGYIKHFKLLSLAGAYWRGDERNPVLQRIYGTAFPTEELLKRYITLREEAKKRDHRVIGKQLDLFSFHEEGPGFPFWHAKGVIIYNEILAYWRAVHQREGYQEIKTPVILSDKLWHRSGHWKNYKENMYFTKIDKKKYAIKPMNCPGGLLIMKDRLWSYRDFPVKFAELGLVHRHEKSGVLSGLFRVRQFTQDDAHVYCLPEHIREEIKKVINLVKEIYRAFGFYDYVIELSTRPPKAIGSKRVWNQAERHLEDAMKESEVEYTINKGEGAFYGPKIDFHILDCYERLWQCGTIQLDFSMPQRFKLEYTDKNGKKRVPVMIHRAVFGSIERFLGILVEHYGGALPFWLAPVQVKILPISEKFQTYANEVRQELLNTNIRVELDMRNEKVGKKIRDCELLKVPYMLIIGGKEEKSLTVSVRRHKKGDQGSMTISEISNILVNERESKK